MEFGWINLFGAVIVVIILIPNIIYAIKNKGEKNLCTNKAMNIIEQIGRYACIILMWLPLFVWKFGFAHVFEMLLYFIGNGALLFVYLFVFALYFGKKTKGRAIILAVLPACIFLLSGLLLRHLLLAGFAILFAIGHIYVTVHNFKSTH
ncbi:MAG: hypothetical protein ACOX4O_02175 [Eubacteriales bacterium]|jgi:hypothetical protein